MTKESIRKSSVLKIGNVISVEGRFVKISVDKTKNSSHLLFNGKPLKNVSVGSFIKICKGFEEIIGKIEGEYVSEDKFESKKEYKNTGFVMRRVLNVSLLGFFNEGRFERGIKELPLLDNECYILDEDEFSSVHDFVKKNDSPIEVGCLSQEKGRKISVGINSLFASHIGIFGNTGSGKSYTLAKLYRQLFNKYKSNNNFQKNAKFFLIDFNGEYVDYRDQVEDNVIIESEHKNTFKLSTRNDQAQKFPVSERMINDPNIWIIVLEATEKTQTPFIRRTLRNQYLNENVSSNENLAYYIIEILKGITTYKDKSLERGLVLNFLSDLLNATERYSTGISYAISNFDQSLKFHNKNNEYYFDIDGIKTYSSEAEFESTLKEHLEGIEIKVEEALPIEIVRLKLILNYYNEIVRGYANKEHLSPLLKRLDKRINDLVSVIAVTKDPEKLFPKNFTIVSLKDVNLHMRKILPLLFCKQFYEDKKKSDNKEEYLNIIIDEAHNILSSISQRESEQWKDYRLETFEEIIKEGRKFGVFLTIASQRPYDISPTIISQLHNYFLHRLINNNDINAIERTVSYLDKVSFEALSILPTGTCILAGLVAQVPVIIEIDKIEEKFKPFNQTIEPIQYWEDDKTKLT